MNESRAVGSNTDSKKVVAIILTVIIMIAGAVFFFGRKNAEEDIPERTWIVDDSDPADIERIKKEARKSRPTAGTYEEQFAASQPVSEAEADALLTEGALAPEAVGDLASKAYNVYDPDLDRQLAGPEQPQETVSPDEVPTPEPVTSKNPVIEDRTADLPDPNAGAEEARRAEEEARRQAEEEAARLAAEEEQRKQDEEAQRKYDELVSACEYDGIHKYDPVTGECWKPVDVNKVSFD